MPTEVCVRDKVEIPIGGKAVRATFVSFDNLGDEKEHVLIIFGRVDPESVPLFRIHSECLTGDVFASLRCDCGQQLAGTIKLLTRYGGCLAYLRQEGRGIGLYAKLRAYLMQDEGLDTFEANRFLGYRDDMRDYAPAAQMMRAIGVKSVRLITNNPDKVCQLENNGVRVVERVGTPAYITSYNRRYLVAKANNKHAIELG
ncbi:MULTISPECIES: GTP cyclohydrolase II RibA [unclassified Bradyrhizobium]|uniref:GTP cyclohydrolase II RibA n=1 Tax=unclassified Bradyrhizobium TaxID=2631580 RepID=UPI0028E3FF96|nr:MULTISPECIES: GTP cyclohydrolase II RibA [unclassified Bradyrhizobium]